MNAKEVLKVYFGYDTYKPGQEEIIEAILAGKDVLAVMPTGAGKSICYQVPAMMLEGITLVISPLISLMQDQVKALNEAGIHAGYINSSLTEGQIAKVYSLAAGGRFKILYVAPERLESYGFLDFASGADISMVTVDEAHCISQWGQDFRPSYLKIVEFIEGLAKRPIVSAFTATATEEVKADISCVLKLQEPRIVSTGFDRENLFFDVAMVRKKSDYVLDYVKNHPEESGILYCATRNNVDKLHDLLIASGIPAAKYHAGMDHAARKESQDDFIYDRLPLIVATNAFGMGIDKSGGAGQRKAGKRDEAVKTEETFLSQSGRWKRVCLWGALLLDGDQGRAEPGFVSGSGEAYSWNGYL
ncbi:MAG: RecQ family ATP-dependent DNA helicase [Lachnospiraceae bacterium]|nr:RecQ family ATP-dependent DNA helicase [Lachnospiraceae bacterium]